MKSYTESDTDAFGGGALTPRRQEYPPQVSVRAQITNQLARREPHVYSVTPWRRGNYTLPGGAVGAAATPSLAASLLALAIGAAVTGTAVGVGAYYGARAARG